MNTGVRGGEPLTSQCCFQHFCVAVPVTIRIDIPAEPSLTPKFYEHGPMSALACETTWVRLGASRRSVHFTPTLRPPALLS